MPSLRGIAPTRKAASISVKAVFSSAVGIISVKINYIKSNNTYIYYNQYCHFGKFLIKHATTFPFMISALFNDSHNNANILNSSILNKKNLVQLVIQNEM